MHLDACSIAPDSWRRLAVKDVCQKVTSGGTPSRKRPEFYVDGNICWVKTKELNDAFIIDTEEKITIDAIQSSSAKVLPAGTILLAMYGATVGMLGVLAKDMACNQACCALMIDEEFDRDYLYYQLLAHRSQLQGLATGAAQQNLSGQQIKELILPFPSKKEQGEIGGILRLLDDRIALLRETNKTLEAIAQAIFKSWFIDFDPVRAKMEGRAPAGLDEETAALFPDELVEIELGLVPKGWEVKTVGENFVLTMGQSPPGDTYNEVGNGMPFYQGRTDFGFRFPSQRIFCSAPTRMAEDGDTLVSVRAPVGDVNMAIERCCLGRGVASVRHPKNYRGFTFYSMRNLGTKFKTFDGEGTVFGSINKKDFASLPVISPSDDVLAKYDDLTESIDQKIVLNELMIRTLIEVRDGLLPRLISGRLRVDTAAVEAL
jgi:type I restriction enzyme S subunit